MHKIAGSRSVCTFFWHVLVCMLMNFVRTSMYQYIQVYTGMYQYVLVHHCLWQLYFVGAMTWYKGVQTISDHIIKCHDIVQTDIY